MRSTWHGLLLEFSCANEGAGPGLRADFSIEEVELVKVADEQEFREYHPHGTPQEMLDKHEQEVRDALYQDVIDDDC